VDQLRFDVPFAPNAAALPARAQAEQTVSKVLLALWRHVYLLLLAVMLALVVGAVILATTAKRYTAEALVQFDFSQRNVASGVQEQARGVLVEAITCPSSDTLGQLVC
jgi:uncharacterized protein involved in exopolysaccharide biosynthesis